MRKPPEYYKDKRLLTLRGEVWEDIPSYEGLYRISNMGRFKSLSKYKKGAWGNMVLLKDRIIVPTQTVHGYLQIGLVKNEIHFHRNAHIWVAIVFIPNPGNKPEVNHKKGNKKDNRASQLEWSTRKENNDHSIKWGLKKDYGDSHYSAKISNRQAVSIYKSKKSNRYLADKYGVKINEVSRIKRGETWAKITGHQKIK